jgi:hypothetical protein
MKNYALYNLTDGLIINTIVLDDNSEYTPNDGLGMVEMPEIAGEWSMCSQGWSYIDGQFVEPPQPESLKTDPKTADQPTTSGTQTI